MQLDPTTGRYIAMICAAVSLIGCCAIASAQVVRKGTCPSIKPVANFDIHKFTGIWYLQYMYYYAPQGNLKCSIINQTVVQYEGHDALEFTERAYDGSTGEVRYRSSLKILDPNNPAKTTNRVHTSCFNDTIPCEYVAVDYHSYFMIYCCKTFTKGFKYETLGIRTRLPQLSTALEGLIKYKLLRLGLSDDFLIPVDENCSIYPALPS